MARPIGSLSAKAREENGLASEEDKAEGLSTVETGAL